MANTEIDCVSNPEFLRQGSAVKDFCNPARIIIGTESTRSAEVLKQLYRPFIRRKTKVMIMDTISAELAKYASNAMLAARISFMNELSLLCEKTGGDIEQIRSAVGSAPRIGADFLNAGIGYGGSCLPKDVAALINYGKAIGCEMAMARAVQKVNTDQHDRFVRQIVDYFNGHHRAKLAVWGLAFKAGTDDIRDSAAFYCIDELLKRDFEIRAYDPLVPGNVDKICNGRIVISDSRYSVLDWADALVIFTDAEEFKKVDLRRVSGKIKVVFDGKNLFEPADLERFGIEYHCIGRKFCQISQKSCNISIDSASLTYKGLANRR
jgi:UDPglucose 6-dehydrogenase